MAQNVTIAGASYNDVPAIEVPKQGAGTAIFCDPSVTTATAADVASGKYFLAADGTLTAGTGSSGTVVVTEEPDTGGGIIKNITVTGSMVSLQGKSGINPTSSSQTITADEGYDGLSFVQINAVMASGLVYETGTHTPNEDIARPQISFTNVHTNRPFCVVISDITSSAASTDSVLMWSIISWYDAFGAGYITSGTTTHYARSQYAYKSSSGATASGSNLSAITGTTNTAIAYYLTNTYFQPYLGSTSRYFRSGRTYKWIAVWKPET